jgi:N-acetylneuraminic acid mutarotase
MPAPTVAVSPSPSGIPQPTGLPPADALAWTDISPARGPAAREDHTWTVDGDGRFAYLFGGRDGGQAFDDLWRFDLASDTWQKLAPRGPRPAARFGHNAVWTTDVGLVVFAGQRGADFFGDLWAYDPTTERWDELPANGAAPKARYGSCMINGPDGRLWISHGFTFAGRFDDTRAYDLATQRWSSIAPDGRRPGERCLHDCFTSATGELVLYGGQDNATASLGDLWVTRSDGTWQRRDDPRSGARRLYAVAEAGPEAWVFGGLGADNDALGDLWRIDRETLEFERVSVSGTVPSARYGATLISDAARGRLLLFGGQGQRARADVWQLGPTVTPSDAQPSGSIDQG